MIITGIAHIPARLHERNLRPSLELTYLAVRSLQSFGATGLITTLAAGWEQALAKAALELEISCTICLPFSKEELLRHPDAYSLYEELQDNTGAERNVLQSTGENRCLFFDQWRIDRADLILALWDYRFQGETYALIEYALRQGKRVVNLWQDWESMLSLRKVAGLPEPLRQRGAQIYGVKKIS